MIGLAILGSRPPLCAWTSLALTLRKRSQVFRGYFLILYHQILCQYAITLPICYNFAKMLWMERALMRVNCPTCPDNSTTSVPLNLDHLIAKVSQNSREQTIRPQCFPKKFPRQCALCPRYNVRTTYFPRSTTFLRLCFEF